MAENIKEIREQYQESFEQILKELNSTQLQAVDTIEGPVLAIAGPGTGKTHILTARIGQILNKTDTQAHNILCLTFTDAGVYAMRERLLQFIGPAAHRVHIFTFHSFCNKVIQENLDLFGRHDLEPLSDLERIEIIRDIIDGLDVEHPLRANRRDPHYYEGHLRDLFKRMKSESWTSTYINERIDLYLEDLPNREEFIYKRKSGKYKKGDLKEARIDDMTRRMERLRTAIFLFDEYDFIMRQRRRYDYEDMILWVLKAFKEQEFLLRNYQEQYLYVLVDEFQDTNGAQSQIVQKLIEYWEDRPNIFIVGDDDQSIYEFQGARVKNMLDFYNQYQETMTLVLLQQNYRSSQRILNASKRVIDHNELRLVNKISAIKVEKNLIASNLEVRDSAVEVNIIEYHNRAQEDTAIVQHIKRLKEEKVALDEIAIIYARHKQAQNIIKLLEKNDISYRTKRRINILELPLIRNLRNLFTYITREYQKPYSGEELFFEILHYSFFDILPYDVARLSAYIAKDTHQRFRNRDYDHIISWRDITRNPQQLDKVGLQNPASISKLGNFLDSINQLYTNVNLPELLERIVNHSGLIRFVSNSPEKAWLIQVVNTLFEFVRRESLKNPLLDLEGLLDILNRMDANKIGLGVYKSTYTEDGVNLITAHSSKGLEFRYVFVLNCLKDYWEPSKENRGKRFAFPDTITYSNSTDALEASRRLFYVAMTRAKVALTFSYFTHNEANKKQQRTQFIDEILANGEVEVQKKFVDNDLLLDWQLLMLTEQQKPLVPLLETATLNALLEDFRLSVSSMNTYINCPLSFYYEYMLRLPSLPSEEASYGTAVHNALDRIFRMGDKFKAKKLPHVSELILAFRQELEQQRVYFSPLSYDNSKELGIRHLPKYYEQRLKEWEKTAETCTVLTEKSYRNVEVKGVPITGTIDKVVFHPLKEGKYIHVVDYKTGKLKEKRLAAPTETNPEGGNYWRQLIFYKILLENSKTTVHSVQSAEIDYLTPDADGNFPQKSIRMGSQEVEIVSKIIVEVYDKIKQHKFSEGCGKPSCKWCKFAKENISPDSFNNQESEQLDDK